MNSSPLLRLETDDFADTIGVVLPPAPLRRVLQQSPDVRDLAEALQYGQITETDLRRFVDRLLMEYRRGEVFRYDVALAALAVAMEHWRNSFAEVYLIDLARIQRRELRASTRIARECLKARYAFPRTQIRTSRYPNTKSDLTGVARDIRIMPRVRKEEREVIGHRWVRYSEVSHACH